MNKPTSMIEFVNDRKGHDFRYAIDYSKARINLDWEPLKDFESGIRETIAWYIAE